MASRALLDACRSLGLDADAISTAAGLSPEQLSDPDARIPAESADALWQQAYAVSSDSLLALHAAEALEFGAYRVLDFLAEHGPSLGASLTAISDYFPLVDPRARLRVDASRDPVILTMEIQPPGGPLPPPAQEYTFAALLLRSRAGTGVSWSPLAVEFSFPEPGDASEHRRLFGARVRFAQAEARLLVARADWNAPSARPRPDLHAVLSQHARMLLEQLPAQEEGTRAAVRRAIAAQLSGGSPSLSVVARELGLGEKTLQRRLKDDGDSFAALLDEVRLEWAELYLSDPKVSLGEVAWLLGFSEQSAFSRAFRRWTGQSPSSHRTARRSGKLDAE